MSSSEAVIDEASHSSCESEIDDVPHSTALKRLETTDPEFYEFLKENDQQLLDYEDEEDLDETEPQDEEGQSDDFSSSDIESLKEELRSAPTTANCKRAMSMLKKCISNIDAHDQLAMLDGSLFNDIMKLCLVELLPALSVVLKLSQNAEKHFFDPSKSRNWKKISSCLKSYLLDILRMSSVISEVSTLELILKHMLRLVPYFVKFIKMSRLLVKKMIVVWSSSSEKARILAFMVIFRVLKRMPEEYFSQILKQLYFAFVKNTKFTSISTLPLISFMKRSLAEVYSQYPEIAYEHTFLYLRQLCIHLRNAITTKKKDTFQTVYNWQYVHCIMLWSEVVCSLYNYEPIKTLMYPLIQLTTGAINLIPTAKYAPLRFHLVRTLIKVSSETKVFIPIAPLVLEVLDFVDCDKKMIFSKKNFNLDCSLKASKSELQESGYRDTIVTETCKLLNEYFQIYAASISFPELSFYAITQLKAFIKKNKIGKYGQRVKALTDQLQQNSNFILKQRCVVPFQITDVDQIEKWENTLLQKGTPLSKAKFTEVVTVKSKEPQEPPRKKKKNK